MSNTSYLLALAGGIITLLSGILASVLGAALTFFIFGIGAVIGVWGMIVGIILIFTSFLMKSKKSKTGSILCLIFSILGIVSIQGFVIGPLLALIGSIISFSEK
jgi:hypothetical protein